MNGSVKTNFALFKAELRKVWGFPILELAVGLMALISISNVSSLHKIVLQPILHSEFNSMIVDAAYTTSDSLLLPLGLLCSILMALSFARDYEQGLMQTLLSSPVSRSSLFIIKFLAVIVPLVFLSWGFTTLIMVLNFYLDTAALFTILGVTAWILPFMLLALMFYGGLATLIALAIRRTIPSALTVMIVSFFLWFVTTLKESAIGDLANYLSLTPFKAPLVSLGRILGAQFRPINTLENTLPGWNFIVLAIVYALIFVIPTYLYFRRRFEVRE